MTQELQKAIAREPSAITRRPPAFFRTLGQRVVTLLAVIWCSFSSSRLS